ncbi:flagellin-like protein [Halarchaeum solikamskense]|uniref:type IV pilin n=1 Tax=Halarchaeum nitratireducens TaxID=489913 RepID=UPI001B3AA292|nr:flagellin-like protein [Halarchaeum solikamskense]
MIRSSTNRERGASSVIGVILLVGIVIVLIGAITPFVMNLAGETQAKAPTVSVDHRITNASGGTDYTTDGDNLIAVTLESGGPIQTDQLYLTSSKAVDIGSATGADGTNAADDINADDEDTPKRERFAEGNDQTGIGDTWEAGETVYLDPDGSATDTSVSIYWTSKPVKAQDEGEISPGDSYEIASFTT